METISLVIILGTAREGRRSERVARLVHELAQTVEGVKAILVDPRDYSFGPRIPDPRFTDITAKADAFYIVSPEYNHGYPGDLKNLLDSEYENYYGKPVVVASVSDGNFGGARMLAVLQPTLHALGMLHVRKDVMVRRVNEVFTEDGKLLDDTYREQILKAINEVTRFARALQTLSN